MLGLLYKSEKQYRDFSHKTKAPETMDTKTTSIMLKNTINKW